MLGPLFPYNFENESGKDQLYMAEICKWAIHIIFISIVSKKKRNPFFVRIYCPCIMFILLSLEQEEVIKMHNKSIPWPLLEQSFSLVNCAAELHPFTADSSVSVHVSTVPSSGLHCW